MDPRQEHRQLLTRRHFFGRSATGIGTAALASLLQPKLFGSSQEPNDSSLPHFQPKAKRVIFLFMSGAPSQMDLWDYKPAMDKYFDQDLPDSVRMGQRITTMTSGQSRFPIAPSMYKFQQYGQSGTWVSELLPHMAKRVDDITVVKTVHTSAINHDPAITFIQTGAEQPGRPSLGAWLSYGLGSANQNLPAFVVLHSSWSAKRDAQALFARLWGTGFLPSEHQGVSLRSKGDPVLYLSDPKGVSPEARRRMLDGLAKLNGKLHQKVGDPEIQARIAQYEMAFRMQSSVPELMDFAKEPDHVLDMYGPDVRKPGTFAANCLLARRLVERDVRFVQIFHRGWDQHDSMTRDLPLQCKDIDQPCAALIQDLKRNGLFDDTLIVWGGEFGRTIYCQGPLSRTNYGRDHHPRCYSMWLAGGGIRGGLSYGETDDFCYNIVDKPVHIHDLNATILHCLGIDHERLIFRYQGRDFRLTDVHGNVVHDLLA
ncbi:MAG: DUF1501 domain-containing protein [Planctomycetota bacterium]|nr:MAG: DUF1501 domain-containing protein [Planctomycetota bacterium]